MKRSPVILYAEDDPDDRELLREAFNELHKDLKMVETANGREALLYLRSIKGIQNPPSLVILDLNMPILNGRETLAIMKSENETALIPVVIFTTSSSPLDEDFCKKFSVEMITKPSTPEELKTVAKHLFDFCCRD